MSRPIVGVIGNTFSVENRFPVQMAGERNLRAIADVVGALPLIFAGCPETTDIATLLDTVDGILLTGARANVHPRYFNAPPDKKHEPYDERRDAVALALVEACVARAAAFRR
jgi:putative glutamine amidotransferase